MCATPADHPDDHLDVLLDPLGAVRADGASNLNRPDPSGVNQIDVEHQAHQAKELAVERTPSFCWSFHPTPLGPTGAHRLECAPDLTCEDSTAYHVLDGAEATRNRKVVGSNPTSG